MSDRPDRTVSADAGQIFDRYLQAIHFRSEVYYRGQVCQDWYLDTSGTGHINVHVVCHGNCWLRLPGTPTPIPLHAGDVVVLPHDAPHLLVSTPDLPTEYGKIWKPQESPHNANGPGTALFCGYLIVDKATYRHVFAMLPEYLVFRCQTDEEAKPFRALIDLLFSETQASGLGASAIIDRLADVLMFYVIRHAIKHGKQTTGLAATLADKPLRAALAAMCDKPEIGWTLEMLAERACLSRSAFADRFTALMGQAPMAFLTGWRMQLARGWLGRDRLSVAEVAARCGYQSEAAFGKAFKRAMGVGPGEFRRVHSPGSPTDADRV